MFNNYPKRGSNLFVFVIYLLFGIYFLNFPFQFISIPENISSIVNPWIIFVGGILIIFGAINYIRVGRRY
jgi:formate hydrogenlyase subunit 3/multisubunit Na+/H+ antiporter MnhD subunit